MNISEISTILGIPAHTIRFWEKELGIEVPRNTRGERIYDEHLVTIFKKVKLMREKGFTLKYIKKNLNMIEESMEFECEKPLRKTTLRKLEKILKLLKEALEE